jgi:Xaa-Pro dipeptidase
VLPYPSFSSAEMWRRREAVTAALSEAGVEHLVVYGANRAGSGVQWLTRWPVTREAASCTHRARSTRCW